MVCNVRITPIRKYLSNNDDDQCKQSMSVISYHILISHTLRRVCVLSTGIYSFIKSLFCSTLGLVLGIIPTLYLLSVSIEMLPQLFLAISSIWSASSNVHFYPFSLSRSAPVNSPLLIHIYPHRRIGRGREHRSKEGKDMAR